MAEQVKITNGQRQLTVSRKAFNAIFKTKGYAVIGEEPKGTAIVEPDSEVEAGAKTPPKATKTRTGSKRKASKKSATKKAAKPDSRAADESTGEEES